MALTGFAILCDWLGSNSEFFPCMPDLPIGDYILHSRTQARNAVSHAGFFAPVRSNAPTSFSALFPDYAPPRPLQVAIDEIPDALLCCPTLTIIEAPTGEGKTEAALALAHRIGALRGTDEFYIALPTTATSNQMFLRVQNYLAAQLGLQTGVRLIHGQAFLIEDDLRLSPLDNGDTGEHPALAWFTPKKRSLLAPFGVGTVDQAELCALNVRHNALRLIGLAGKVVILDEVHAYDVYMTTIIERMLTWLKELGASVILLSATLPNERRRALIQAFGAHTSNEEIDAYPLITTASGRATQYLTPPAYQPERTITLRTLSLPQHDADAKAVWLLDQVRDGGCACWITNTVQEAQDLFAAVCQCVEAQSIAVDLLLLHARFPLADRQTLEQAVMHRYGPKGQRPERGIVIGTQVLEQSLDLDFDVMVSDLAPVDLLLQRAGRLHRHARESRPQPYNQPIFWIYAPLDAGGRLQLRHHRIYTPYLLAKTWQILSGRTSLRLPGDYRSLLEQVYAEDAPDPTSELYPYWQRMMEQHQHHQDEARIRIVREPDPEEAFSLSRDIPFHEDEESSAWIVAQTRLGQESITLIPLERLDDNTARLIPHADIVALDQPADRATQYRLLQRSIRVSHFALVHALRDTRDDSPLFRNATLLQGVVPLWLQDGKAELTWNDHTYIVQLDARLGFVIKQKEDL
jgi:CRISPR-associated endonuclease/helicase Cas3